MTIRETGCHRPWFKVLFNPMLRWLQFWTCKPYVIYTRVNLPDYRIIGYGFGRVVQDWYQKGNETTDRTNEGDE